MITFPKVPLVNSGDAIASSQLIALADAFNARLRSGLADGPWRIVFYMLGLFRQIRNPAGEDASLPAISQPWPPNAEFFHAYQMLKPTNAQYPVAGAGDPEGINLANVMGQFVFGVGDFPSEDDRTTTPELGGVALHINGHVPTNAEEAWTLAKYQRGAVDPNTGELGSPTLSAARQHFNIQPSIVSPHGNSYGGYIPTPEYIGDCGDSLDFPTPNYQIFFTNLNTGATQVYPGSCPNFDGNVFYIARTASAYYVFLVGGAIDILPYSDWIEGPYTAGARLMKQPGQHLQRVLNNFVSYFTGTEDQKRDGKWNEFAFDTQRFLTTQYLLAPSIGYSDGTGNVYSSYRGFKFAPVGSTIVPSGTLAKNTESGGTSRKGVTGFVYAALFAKATKLFESCTIQVVVNGANVQTFSLSPDSTGNATVIVILDNIIRPDSISFSASTPIKFTATDGKIDVECAELYEYKPELHDLYLLLRLGAANVSLSGGLDGAGENESRVKDIENSYFQNGCIINNYNSSLPGSVAEINTNAVFEAARKLSQIVRIIPRQQFVGYEVSGGKSICYFKRLAYGQGNDNPVDLFEGIAPARDEILTGSIVPNRRYTVRSGTVSYASQNYGADQQFTGILNIKEFQGSGHVYEFEGIRPIAEPEQWSNEWLMGSNLRVYNPVAESLFNPDSYSDFFALSERCHFYHPLYPQDVIKQFDYASYTPDQKTLGLNPESPTGYRYIKGTNTPTSGTEDEAIRRYKSCRIYEPDPDIESATVLIEANVEIVKLVFKTRFHHCASAPSTISRDVSTWTITDIETEVSTEYRSAENGLREYLVQQYNGNNCTPGIGDYAFNSGYPTLTTNIYGSCYPCFYFVKLVEKPYNDGNDSQDSTDTPLTTDNWRSMEVRLRAMCEGYVDGTTTQKVICQQYEARGLLGDVSPNSFDYTYENLCFDAFHGRWINTIASTQTKYLSGARADRPQGFGPLPNTEAAAEIFNQFAACVNLLDKVRVPLPYDFEARQTGAGTATKEVSQTDHGSLCSVAHPGGDYITTEPAGNAYGAFDAWGPSSGLAVFADAQVEVGCSGGGNWVIRTGAQKGEWRYALTDPNSIYAIPDSWADMIATGAASLFGIHSTDISQYSVEDTGSSDTADKCGLTVFSVGGYWKFTQNTSSTVECGIMSAFGALTPKALPSSIIRCAEFHSGSVDTYCFDGPAYNESRFPILGIDNLFITIPVV